jgi:hypothetical protein
MKIIPCTKRTLRSDKCSIIRVGASIFTIIVGGCRGGARSRVRVGEGVGQGVGLGVGFLVGLGVGTWVGLGVGFRVGRRAIGWAGSGALGRIRCWVQRGKGSGTRRVGLKEGCLVGLEEGLRVGKFVGLGVGIRLSAATYGIVRRRGGRPGRWTISGVRRCRFECGGCGWV